jgi:uncharacterized protein YaeQ
VAASLHAFDVELSDAVRGLSCQLGFRTARHPSETLDRLAARVLAFCLEYEEGLDFSPGLSTRDVPAMWRRDAAGSVVRWVEVGAPSAARLARALRQCSDVAVYAHRAPLEARRHVEQVRVPRRARLRLVCTERGFATALGASFARRSRFSLTRDAKRLRVRGRDLLLEAGWEEVRRGQARS